MNQDAVLTSVGIDIGTTTTQLVISRLALTNVMPGSQIPKIEISEKSICYIGAVHFTPLIDRQRVDGAALRKIVAGEYERAGYAPADIDTGAIIITGETAKKDNASEIIHSLAEYAGDFVVATAGPDLESIIAGKGSGAEEISKKERCTVANVDIGGGTTNIAVFDCGKCIGTACVNVGGRLVEIDELTHNIKYVALPARKVIEKMGCSSIVEGRPVNMTELVLLLNRMAESVDNCIFRKQPDSIDSDLLMTDSMPAELPDKIVFSGGVARYIYQPGVSEWWMHGDVGPLLAEAFRRSKTFSEIEIVQGSETIHATVLGAGAHTVNVSGSTIAFDKDCLPLRNVPAVYPDILDGEKKKFSWKRQADNFNEDIYHTIALVVPPLSKIDFINVSNLAANLAEELPDIKGKPKVIIAGQDIAKALGQSLLAIMPDLQMVCLDGIELGMGDYIDIARPLPHQDAVPVIVKTLVFAK